jgi:hypothetical protein
MADRWAKWNKQQQQVIAGAEIGVTSVVQSWVDRNAAADPKLATLDPQVKADVARQLEDAQEALGSGDLRAKIKFVPDRMSDCTHVLVAIEEDGQ